MTTLFVILFSIGIALPFGLFAAIYLVEYKLNPRANKIIHFAIDSLADIEILMDGIPLEKISQVRTTANSIGDQVRTFLSK